MTRTSDGGKAIEGQKPIGEQNARRRKEGLECPACRFKIRSESDHEPGCENGDWDRQDVIDHIMKKSAKQRGADSRADPRARPSDFPDKHEMYGSGWPR